MTIEMLLNGLLMRMTLVLGPTDNRRHTIARGRGILIDTSEYKAWKIASKILIKNALPRDWKPITPSYEKQQRYHVQIKLPNKRSDQTNYLKSIQDALTEAGVWEDDKWVYPVMEPCEVMGKDDPMRKKYPNTATAIILIPLHETV